MTRTPSSASCGAWSLLLLSAGIGAVRGSPLKSANNIFTSDKFEYNPLNNIPESDKMTLIQLLKDAARVNGDKLAFQSPEQDKKGNLVKNRMFPVYHPDGSAAHKYDQTTWQQYHDKVMQAAAAFVRTGLQPMDAVNIRGVNAEEWLVAFMGSIAAGGLPVGLYPTDSPDALKFKAKDSGAAFIVLGRAKDVAIYSDFIGELGIPKVNSDPGSFSGTVELVLPKIILWDSNRQFPDYSSELEDAVNNIGAERFFRWADFMKQGDDESKEEVERRIKEQMPGQAGSVVYTSGTTGNPKGVMLSQDSLAWSARTIAKKLLTVCPPSGQFRSISFLPLNHVAGQMMDIIGPLYLASQEGTYSTLFFPAMCYLKKVCSVEMLIDAKPVIFLGVPEVWDGFKLKLDLGSQKGIGKIASWEAILNSAGLDKVMYAISGAGSINPTTISFFNKLGIRILNMFAQSESSGLGTAWTNQDFDMDNIEEKFGSIGKALGNELKLDETPDDGEKKQPRNEIMLKGRNMMLGYLNEPEKTAEAFKDGWLMTGDKGRIDSDGFVFLTDRFKEIMKIQGEQVSKESLPLKAAVPSSKAAKPEVATSQGEEKGKTDDVEKVPTQSALDEAPSVPVRRRDKASEETAISPSNSAEVVSEPSAEAGVVVAGPAAVSGGAGAGSKLQPAESAKESLPLLPRAEVVAQKKEEKEEEEQEEAASAKPAMKAEAKELVPKALAAVSKPLTVHAVEFVPKSLVSSTPLTAVAVEFVPKALATAPSEETAKPALRGWNMQLAQKPAVSNLEGPTVVCES